MYKKPYKTITYKLDNNSDDNVYKSTLDTLEAFKSDFNREVQNGKHLFDYFLCCTLADDEYADVNYEIFYSANQFLKANVFEDCVDDIECMDTVTFEIIKVNDNYIDTMFQVSFSNGDKFWKVALFPINNSLACYPYLSIKHHAYNGVDFELICGDNKVDCLSVTMDNIEASGLCEHMKSCSINQMVFDDGNEYTVYDIINTKATMTIRNIEK